GAVSATSDDFSHSGGFVGYVGGTVTISSSTNAGTVSATSDDSSHSGGFVGYAGGTVTISSSTNAGTVSAITARSYSYSYSGGFMGEANKGQILNSYNTGSVHAKDTIGSAESSKHLLYAGGLVGYLGYNMTIKNAYSATNSVSYSFKTGYSYGYAGTLVGLSKGSLQNVYFDSDLLSRAAIGRDSSQSKANVGGFSTANMQRDLFAWQLNSTGGTEENSKIWSRNGGYPIFADTQNKPIYKVVFDDEGATTNRYSNNKGIVKFLEDPEPASGYVFVAWVDSSGNLFSEKSTLSSDKKVSAYYALETSPQYVIDFLDAESKLWVSRLTHASGKLESLPEPPAPDSGYYFMGWYDSLYSRIDTMTVFTENATLSAKYGELKDLSYTVVFLNVDGDTLQSSPVKYGSVPEYTGATPTLAPTVEYSYSFKGWDSSLLPVTGPATYTATYNATINQYTISFVNYNDSVLQSEVLPYGSAVTYKGTTPTRESTVAYNYVFKSFDKAVKSVTGTETYKALYDSSLVTYEVVFKNGSEVVNTQYVEYGKAATAPENPTRSGYIFIGWDKSFSKITAATVVNAMFSVAPKHQLIVYVDGQVFVEETPEEGSKYVLPEAPEKEGHTFVGWYDGNTFVGNAGDTITISGDISIEARYEAKVYTIAFKNGTTTLQSSELAYGTTPKYSGSTPTKASTGKYAYTFASWSPSIVSVTGAATYTAVFDSTLRSYTVAFKNGSTTLQSSAVAYGTTPKYNGTTPTKASTAKYEYTFAGWSPSIVSVTGAATYTAVFDSTLRSYTIAFKNGNTTLQSTEVAYGTTPKFNGSTPTKASSAKYEYTFAGWSPSIVSVTGTATYTATFDSTLRSYTIAFKNGNTTLQSSTVAYGTTPKFNGSAPTKASTAKYEYTFAGWSPDIVSVTGTATYTATFDSTLRKYSITIDDGYSQTETEANYLFVLPDAPEKDGYEFIGWYNGDEKLGMPGDTIQVIEELRISAKWEKTDAIFATSLPRFNLSVTGKSLQVSGVQANTPVAVFDMQGRIVKRLMAPGSNFVLEIPHAGHYIVRVGKQVQKIRVK
uniref:InlB B-repeat-containing protein n=1 Tax=uncultured Fibrobacter sp. TaxID=261512 RepID=UPI00280469EF